MSLIPLPFQSLSHTHLASEPIKGNLTVRELPVAYHNLLNLSANGGYTTASYLKTTRPTLDGEDTLYVPYIAGLYAMSPKARYLVPNLLDQAAFPFHDAVAAEEIIFYADHDRVLTFDYREAPIPNQPRIVYHEFSTDRAWVVAPQFQWLLTQLKAHPQLLPHPSLDSYHRANAAFLHVRSPRELAHYFAHYADPALNVDASWYQAWLTHFQNQPTRAYQQVAHAAWQYLDTIR